MRDRAGQRPTPHNLGESHNDESLSTARRVREEAPVARTARAERRVSLAARVGFIVIATLFALVTRYVYVDIFAATGVFDYMGVRALPASTSMLAVFTALAVLPAAFLPVHLRRPSDVIPLFLFYAVHIPTIALLPVLSYSTPMQQIAFGVAITLALLALDGRYSLPSLRLTPLRLTSTSFWTVIAGFTVLSLMVFARSGYLSLSNVSFVDVYGQREALTENAAQIGPLFFYLANWSGAAVAPFVLVIGLHTRRPLLVLGAIGLATLSFVVSSNKANYIAVPAVIAGFFAIRGTSGRHIATIMGAAFVGLAFAALATDAFVAAHITGINAPVITFQTFNRIFTNNGFLSAVYLDLFRNGHYAFYADSFLRWLPGPRLDAPVPILAGQSFTDVPGVWANANLWADGYANGGLAGIAFMCLLTTAVLWLYDSVARRKDPIVATAALIVPASVLANTSTHVAFVSNGIWVVFALLYLSRDADTVSDRGPVHRTNG